MIYILFVIVLLDQKKIQRYLFKWCQFCKIAMVKKNIFLQDVF